MDAIRVLYVGLKHDYGDPRRGLSFEYESFFETLSRMKNVEAHDFAFDVLLRSLGRRGMNAKLTATIDELRPHLCFFVLFTDEIEKETLRTITRSERTRTLNWFCDDHWRFDIFSRHVAPCFHWVATTDALSAERYRRLGHPGVIKTQWACNHFRYQPVSGLPTHDVSFVGQAHSSRRKSIDYVSARGVHVDCWGRGWSNGRVSHGRMLEIFSRSKVNLNFTESSISFGWKPVAKIVLKRRADNTILLNSLREIRDTVSTMLRRQRPQIKGRNFEIPGTGGFLLTGNAEQLEEYYASGKEIEVFRDLDELVDKARFYLTHEEERERIRRAGYERTLREHTYEHRINEILRIVGLMK